MLKRVRKPTEYVGTVWRVAACVGASGLASAASAEEILLETFSADSIPAEYDFQQSADFFNADQVGAMRRTLSESLPDGTQFVSDRRGAGAHPIDRRARFITVKAPIYGDQTTGVYAQFGFGRDRELKSASGRLLGTKAVIGARFGFGEGMESFVEYRQLRGFDWDGVSAAEHQTSIGVTIRF